jgi:hypothetical protein
MYICISYLSSVRYTRREDRERKERKKEHVNHTITALLVLSASLQIVCFVERKITSQGKGKKEKVVFVAHKQQIFPHTEQ